MKSLENAEKNPKAIDSWIESISELHRCKPPATVHYSRSALLHSRSYGVSSAQREAGGKAWERRVELSQYPPEGGGGLIFGVVVPCAAQEALSALLSLRNELHAGLET